MGCTGVITHLLTIDPNFLGHPSKWVINGGYYLLTNSSHLKIRFPKRKVVSIPPFFRGYVSFREGNWDDAPSSGVLMLILLGCPAGSDPFTIVIVSWWLFHRIWPE